MTWYKQYYKGTELFLRTSFNFRAFSGGKEK